MATSRKRDNNQCSDAAMYIAVSIFYYLIDTGEFRVIYDIEGEETVRIILAGKRNDDEVYKRLRDLR